MAGDRRERWDRYAQLPMRRCGGERCDRLRPWKVGRSGQHAEELAQGAARIRCVVGVVGVVVVVGIVGLVAGRVGLDLGVAMVGRALVFVGVGVRVPVREALGHL